MLASRRILQVARTNVRFMAKTVKDKAAAKIVEKPFDKILIANRGEIACRVMRTAKRLGIKTVAIYSDVDARSMHVSMADEAYCVGGFQSADSYLRMDRILEVAKKTGAQGIHPGYGFLSENAKFADMVESAGIAFIGPSSAPMNSMGDKIESKKVAKDAKCFTIPGYEGEVADEDMAAKLAAEVGYPVMIKASAGGGGKGMRVAFNEAEVREGFRISKAEALSSFGDDRMLIERFIENPHHIEIQVLADTHGNVVAFPERECSVQRRNQKVVEESPSMLVDKELRLQMQEQAIMLCKATNYRSAGTIEMLADENRNFYFLEMNTRLQVEHPITELVTREDLVEHMLWIAAGKKLPARLLNQKEHPGCLHPNGWAIESRVYAEDPLRNFLPSIGPLVTYREPQQLSGAGANGPDGPNTVRIDTGVYEGGNISMFYDPMIAKLVTHAPTRDEAVDLMSHSLDNYVVNGLGNNISFCRDVMRNKKFQSGHYSTKFIEEEYAHGYHGVVLNDDERYELIAVASAMHQISTDMRGNTAASQAKKETQRVSEEGEGEEELIDDMYVTLPGVTTVKDGKASLGPTTTFKVELNLENELALSITPIDNNGKKLSKGKKLYINGFDWALGNPIAKAFFSLGSSNGEVAEGVAPAVEEKVVQFEGLGPEGYHLRLAGSQQYVVVRSKKEQELATHMLAPEVKDVSRYCLCPMPGSLISISVEAGQTVVEGQALAVVEAMKMQNVLKAAKAGVVKSVKAKAGDRLKVDQILVEFEVADE